MSYCEKIREMISQGWLLIDVREPQEFAGSHIKDAANIPLRDDVTALEPDNRYMLYCRSGARSGSAANYLNQQGIEAVNIGGIFQYADCVEM
jgi:phage shock protein E